MPDTELSEAERRTRAVRTVAACAHDADDLRHLLDMLGLDPTDALPPEQRPAPVPAPRRAKGQGLPIVELTALVTAAVSDRG